MDNKSIVKGLLGDLEDAIRSSDAVPAATKPAVLGGIDWLRRNIIDPPVPEGAKLGASIDPDLERLLAGEEEIERRHRSSVNRELILNALELERDRLAYEESNISEAIKTIKKLPLNAPLFADPR